jgi:hypothetical protein
MALKSSWELALERTGGKATGKLTSEQKARLAELDRVYAAKIAECELELQPKIAAARAAGDPETAGQLETMLRAEIQKLRNKLETEKDAVRQTK